MIITIDGPAGSGKSSAARLLASRLGFEVLDTGAMYRAAALVLAQVDLGSPADLQPVLAGMKIEMPADRVVVNGSDVTSQIRTPEAAQAASRVAAIPIVRHYLAQQQRAIAQNRNMVCEGRDQGTAVFPDAACKFFLVADPTIRAQRRWLELQSRGGSMTLQEVLIEQEQRDERDSHRSADPLRPAADAIQIDTTHLSIDAVVDRLVREVRSCLS